MTTITSRKPWGEKNIEKDVVKLRVIGAGLPRTGTTSLKAALEILGFGPCHHMVDLFKKPNRTLEFIRAYDGENVNFYKLMEGYGSTVDAPTCDFYKEIHQAYPQAKIILSVRDSDEKWFESLQNTIGSVATDNFYYFAVYPLRFLRLQSRMGWKCWKRWTRYYDGIKPSMHDQHNKRVINENKEGDVLIFNVKEGWLPLCKFLEVDIPQDIPFPNINDTKEFNRKILLGKILGTLSWIALGTLLILSIYIIMKIFMTEY
ncbi:unnamed protein product [Adineta steineri]|uniref:Uncharacterized protein n=1 Tax=Adineta steineri TaxID=433720 RepID=A0A819GRK3_9BILA|nr:unnamed protein product [Adineta steineri]CAF3890284.1 unnamed protein product [Adineta steineri]